MHSPQDDTVGIQNAEEIYKAAHHPKSFISLDGADHLLMQKKDSLYVGEVVSGWSQRYLDIEHRVDPSLGTHEKAVANLDIEDVFTTDVKAGPSAFLADEPEDLGGNNFGPSPYDLIAAGLASCTAMTLSMYVRRKKWPLENVEVHVDHHQQEEQNTRIKKDVFERQIFLEGSLDEKQRQRLLQIADKCPVHKTLESTSEIKTKLLS